MQISIVHKSKLERTTRIDAEYYRSDFISLIETLTRKKTLKLTDLCNISDGNHMSIAKYFIDDSSGVPYLRGQDISGFFIENVTPIFIPEEIYHRTWMERSHFKTDDILLTIVGTIGSISLVTEKFQKATGSCKIAILRPEHVCPKYLSAFLFSKYGQYQLKRSIRGAVQTGLILEDFDQFLIYTATPSFQKQIHGVITNAIAINRQSKILYQQAEHLLLSELGLADWKPTHRPTFVRNFSEFLQADRLDAEYFQPKYEYVIDTIKRKTHCVIRDIQEFNRRGVQPKYVEDGKINVVTSKHLGSETIAYENLDHTTEERWQKSPVARIKAMDILIYTTGAHVGRTQCFLENKKALASNHVNILRVKELNPVYTALFLNSLVGQLQVQRFVSGSAQVELYPSDIARIVIWKAPETIQTDIANLIRNSHIARKQSKSLLDIAKRGVEVAIEQDEQSAETWMREQVQALEIEHEHN